MNLLKYIKDYFLWHYSRAIIDLFFIWKDIIWFFYNYFSISLLLRTIFSPWKRIGEERKGTFDFVFIVIDILMRIFGFIVRSITVFAGFMFIFLTIILGPLFLFAWLALPVLMVLLVSKGINLLIN